jgi:RimJ/RimL family protein N-acetyltransferase
VHVPDLLHTQRLVLRPWRASDAAALAPILEANHAFVSPWIPPRISTPAPVPDLEIRLQQFADDFNSDKEWRYAMLTRDSGSVLGEISVFPRSADARVRYGESDRFEVGYWIRQDFARQGLATEAVRTVIAAVANDPRFSSIEIRCDPRNEPSNAIPRALGFAIVADAELRVWSRPTV